MKKRLAACLLLLLSSFSGSPCSTLEKISNSVPETKQILGEEYIQHGPKLTKINKKDKLKIGILGDVHADYNHLEKICNEFEREGVDIIINTGDNSTDLPDYQEEIKVFNTLCRTNKLILNIPGNHDIKGYWYFVTPEIPGEYKRAVIHTQEIYSNFIDLRETRIVDNGIVIISNPNTPPNFLEHAELDSLVNSQRADIFVSHEPYHKAPVNIGGHTHKQASVKKENNQINIDSGTALNGDYVIINIGKDYFDSKVLNVDK